MTGGNSSAARNQVGRTLMNSLTQCSLEAAAYGKCCVAQGKDISPGACAKEFDALRMCCKRARKK